MKKNEFGTELVERHVWQVSELNLSLKSSISQLYSRIWVEGEISNLARPASGHLYFTIKDDQAQIRCVIFRNSLARSTCNPEHGDHVIIRASASVYEARGDLQLICEEIEAAGDGLLQKLFEATKQRLFDEGLFDPARKRSLPSYPRSIAVISSGSGAALQDFRKVVQRRYPIAQIALYDVLVQGKQAIGQIQSALAHIQQRAANYDAIAIVRGGGSLEDLWAFNDESLARQIAHCPIPVITGIGHEIDFTIADFVADVRAPTPSAAAELLTPDRVALSRLIGTHFEQLRRTIREQLQTRMQTTDWYAKRLYRLHPDVALRLHSKQLQALSTRLHRLQQVYRMHARQRLQDIGARLTNLNPKRSVDRQCVSLSSLARRMHQASRAQMNAQQHRLGLCISTMNAVNPLQTLNRGYSIAFDNKTGRIVDSYKQLSTQDTVQLALKEGHIKATVEECSPQSLFKHHKLTGKLPD